MDLHAVFSSGLDEALGTRPSEVAAIDEGGMLVGILVLPSLVGL